MGGCNLSFNASQCKYEWLQIALLMLNFSYYFMVITSCNVIKRQMCWRKCSDWQRTQKKTVFGSISAFMKGKNYAHKSKIYVCYVHVLTQRKKNRQIFVLLVKLASLSALTVGNYLVKGIRKKVSRISWNICSMLWCVWRWATAKWVLFWIELHNMSTIHFHCKICERTINITQDCWYCNKS